MFNAKYSSRIKDQARRVYLWKHATRHYRNGQVAGRATNQQSIHHVRPWNWQFGIWRKLERVDVVETLQIHKKLKKARDYLGSAQKHNCGTIVERYLEDEQYQVRTHARRRIHAIRNGRIWQKSKLERIYVTSSEERAYHRDQYEGRTTLPTRRQRHRKGRRTPWIQTHCTVEKGKHGQTILSIRCWTVVMVVFMDVVSFIKVSTVGFFVFTNKATITVTCHIICPSNSFWKKAKEHKLRATCWCDTNQFVNVFELTIGEWQSERWVGTDTRSHAHLISVLTIRRTCDAVLTLVHFLRFKVGLKSDSIKSSDADSLHVSATITTSTTTNWHLCICAITCATVWQYDVTPNKHRLWAQRLYQH